MTSLQNSSRQIFRDIVGRATFAIAIFLLLAMAMAPSSQAQTYTVLHSFTNQGDGGHPDAGVTVDAAGNLYGTAPGGGASGNGLVFRMTRHGGVWTFAPLYSFQNGGDGQAPEARVVFGPDGSLYGTTAFGGSNGGFGTVFNLRPPAHGCQSVNCPWTETTLHTFSGGTDGAYPGQGDLVFDHAGNVYGTTQGYGSVGTVFELTKQNGAWAETTLYTFTHGETPVAGVVFDSAGNLYGTTTYGGINNNGTVFELSPAGSGWTYQTLYEFQNNGDGQNPLGGVTINTAGDLYGCTVAGAKTVYELQPSNGNWVFTSLYAFSAYSEGCNVSLTFDPAGNFYGTVAIGGTVGEGIAFKMSYSGGSWTETDLYNFGIGGKGAYPYGSVALDTFGNLYSTTNAGGEYGQGVVWQLTQ